MCKNEQKPELQPEKRELRAGTGIMFMKTRAPELELSYFYDCAAAWVYGIVFSDNQQSYLKRE